jgi:mono/diheme cytochrome c family protein
MDVLLAFGAALLAFRLAGRLLRRGHATWAAALGSYAIASGALAWGAAHGWDGPSFRVYYVFGGLLTAPLLGAGSLRLAGRRWAVPAALVWAGLAVGIAVAVPVRGGFAGTAIPEAQQHLALFPARIAAIAGNSLGTLAVVAVAVATFRARPVGNALILAGVSVAAVGSTLAGLGIATTAASFALGVALLYAGVAGLQWNGMRRLLAAAVLALAVAVPAIAAARGDQTAGSRLAAPTYYGAVGPILNEKCAGCHTLGGVAPFPLRTAADAHRYADSIAAVVKSGAMPPWPPAADSSPFVGQGHRVLSAAERQALVDWAAAGAPAGSARPLPQPAATARPPGSRVLALAPAKAYLPSTKNGSLDDYHCFLLDPKLARNTYITGATIEPSATALVHHVILFEAAGAAAGAATRENAASGGNGWTCFGGPGLPTDTNLAAADALRFGSPQWLAAWVPGHVTNDLPAGHGILLHRGSKIVMQVHYNLAHGAKPDRSRALLTTAPRGAKVKPLETMLLAAPVELPCPRGASGALCTRAAAMADLAEKYGAGARYMPTGLLFLCGKSLADYPNDVGDGTAIATSCDRTAPQRLTIYGVAGHMHLRGRDVTLKLISQGKERTLLHIPAWDFRWQDQYFLKQPIAVRAGDTLRLSCRFDNSANAQPPGVPAPRYVLWGEGTTDEMCLGALSVALG